MTVDERERKRSDTVTRTELVLPPMTNSHGTMYGGRVLEMMDMTCGIAAMRFCRGPVVTVSSERVDFRVPIRAGYIVELNARVVFTGRTSMTVKVEVFSQAVASTEKRLCTVGFFNFVALDVTGKTPVVVPELITETDEEKRDFEEAERLRRARLHH
jgi:acyl-CoA hydrolase